MRRLLISGAFVAIALSQSTSMAMDILDLPDPGAMSDGAPSTYAPSVMLQNQTFHSGSVFIGSISRKSNGSTYTVNVAQPGLLQRLSISVDNSSVKLYETTVITESGQRIVVPKLSNTGKLDTSTFIASDDLGLTESVKQIEVHAESFSSEADITLKAVSTMAMPKMSLQSANSIMTATDPAAQTPGAAPDQQAPQQQQQPVDPVAGAPAQNTPPAYGGGYNQPVQPSQPAPVAPPAPVNTAPGRALGVNEKVLIMDRDFALATVIGQTGGGYTVRFERGVLAGQTSNNVPRAQLAIASGCYKTLCVDDSVYALAQGFDYARVEIAGYDVEGKYVVRFMSGAYYKRLGAGWVDGNLTSKQRCGKNFCINDYAYLEVNANQIEYVKVLGVDPAGKYLVRFENGALTGRMGHNWSEKEMGKVSGCSGRYCVGQTVFVPSQNAQARILALQENGAYIIDFISGPNRYRMGAGWRAEHFR